MLLFLFLFVCLFVLINGVPLNLLRFWIVFVFFFLIFEITLYFPVMVMINVSIFCNEDDDERSDKAITTTAAFKTAVTTRFCKQYHKKRL